MALPLEEPKRPLDPTHAQYWTWDPRDQAWWRIYHQDTHTESALARRKYGPSGRFDHHRRDANGDPQNDPALRSITYLGDTMATAGAEVFWDAEPGELEAKVCPRHWIAEVRPTEPLKFLDLRRGGADLIGATAELHQGPVTDREKTQRWAQAIYEDFGPKKLHGVIYPSSHTEGGCIALFDYAGLHTLEVVRSKGVPRERQLQLQWRRFRAAYTHGGRRPLKVDSGDCAQCAKLALGFMAKAR